MKKEMGERQEGDLFSHNLSRNLLDHLNKYKGIALEIYQSGELTRITKFGICKYEYFDGALHSYSSTDNGVTFHRNISHPVASEKDEELWRITYDVVWMDALLETEEFRMV